MDRFTEFLKVVFGGIVTAVSGFLGGMDGIMYALIAFITLDYITGVAVAVKQKKVSSEVGFWGIFKKALILALVGIANLIDRFVVGDGNMVRTAIILYYTGNEGISLLENAAAFGIPLPDKLKNILGQLKEEGK